MHQRIGCQGARKSARISPHVGAVGDVGGSRGHVGSSRTTWMSQKSAVWCLLLGVIVIMLIMPLLTILHNDNRGTDKNDNANSDNNDHADKDQ